MREKSLSEITLRRYERPSKELSDRDLIKRICLSLGLLNPGDSRDAIVDTLYVLNSAEKPLTSRTIMKQAIEFRKKNKLSVSGLTYTNVCRQLRRLRSLMLVEMNSDAYQIAEKEQLLTLFNERIIPFYVENITVRIQDYLTELKERNEQEKKSYINRK